MKKKIKILIWVISGIIAISIVVFVSTSRKNALCTKITVKIADTANLKLIDEKEIISILESGGKKVLNQPVKQINISQLERKLNKFPLIKHAEIYLEINGELVAKVIPRYPVVRVCNRLNQHFRIDKEGFIMPVSSNHPTRLVVASGNISYKPKFDTIYNIYNKKYDKRIDIKTLRDIHTLALFIDSNPFWAAQVQQIFINDEDEIEISTLVGDQIVLLGNIENYEEKFRNLEIFYKKGMSVTGWNAYKEINLKYKNQVVCVKSE